VADSELDDDWTAHCHDMALATYAIADHCDDPEMLADYMRLAAQWLRLAAEPRVRRPS